jgi:hypothetical protein
MTAMLNRKEDRHDKAVGAILWLLDFDLPPSIKTAMFWIVTCLTGTRHPSSTSLYLPEILTLDTIRACKHGHESVLYRLSGATISVVLQKPEAFPTAPVMHQNSWQDLGPQRAMHLRHDANAWLSEWYATQADFMFKVSCTCSGWRWI